MSEDASYELQVAIVKAIKADTAVAALIHDRVYDRVPMEAGKVTAKFPYVSFGPEQEIPADADCIPGSEFIIQIDAWSRAVGFPEVKRISSAVKRALNDENMEIAENALVYLTYEGRRVLRDSDGLTSHAVLSFRAMIEER